MSKASHGGRRPGAGAPRKRPTTTIAVRVPVEWAAEIRAILDQEIARRKALEENEPKTVTAQEEDPDLKLFARKLWIANREHLQQVADRTPEQAVKIRDANGTGLEAYWNLKTGEIRIRKIGHDDYKTYLMTENGQLVKI